jgi:uncharacterized membrane protein HdeD (DUF308 family)
MSTEHTPSVIHPIAGARDELSHGPIGIHEFQHLRSHWCWFVWLGALLALCGAVAVIFPIVSSAAVIDVLAVIFLIAGVATIVGSFWAGKWSGLLVHLLVGVLYVVTGFIITERPYMTIVFITIFIAVTFIVSGAFRILSALLIHYPQWGWSLLNGVVTMLLGIIIFRHLPVSALWVIGLLVGLEMLFSGWTWIMLGLAIRNLPRETAT